MPKLRGLGTADIQFPEQLLSSFVAALANINEPQLSDKARALESAGREEDTAFISANLAAFLKGLEQIVSSIAVPQSDYATDDTDFLRSQLTQIAEACENYDSRAAKTGLAALEARQWSVTTSELIAQISEAVLCGDFDAAGELAGKAGRE